jgi:multidrug efflux pump subunit AcrA (membrane-fusion protein)
MGPRSIALIGLLAAASGGCGSAPPAGAAAPPGQGDPTVRRGAFQARVLLTGELEAVRSDTITVPRTPAWQVTIRWMAEDGSRVRAGEPVLELDNSQFSGDLEQKRLAASRAQNELASKQADVATTVARQEFEVEKRRNELERARLDAAIPEKLRSRREHQDSQLALARAEHEQAKALELLASTRRSSAAEVAELEVALERARDEIRAAREAIGALTLRAPRDGILVVAEHEDEGRKLQVGDMVWVGLPVLAIPDLSAMNVVGRLIDVDDGSVAVGMPVRCTVDAYPDRTHDGEIVEIAPIAREQGGRSLRRAFRVLVRLADSDPERMRPGMSVRIEALGPPLADALIVPRAAIDFGVEPPRARLAGGGTAEIRLGPCAPLECVVQDGLDAGTPLRFGT